MAKLRLKFILLLLALLVIGGGVYIYFDRFAPVTMDEKVSVDIWYVDGGVAWDTLEDIIEEYNKWEGADTGITVTLRAFETEAELQEALSSDGDMPNMVFCETGMAAMLSEADMLAGIDDYFDAWRLSEFPEKYVSGAKVGGYLLGLPVLSETDIMLLNTDMFADVDSLGTYERVCAVSEEYYKRNGSSFYTLEDYSDFFRLMILRLGGEFDGVSPHDSDDDDCRYLYNEFLAPSALNRGFDLSVGDAAQSVANGDIPCAVVSSASAAEVLDGNDNIELLPVPSVKKGNDTAVERLTLLCILKGSENEELASCLFAEWFSSEEINTRFAKGSGCLAISGESTAGKGKNQAALYELLDELTSNDDTVIYPPDAVYEENRIEFNLNLATLMDGLRNK